MAWVKSFETTSDVEGDSIFDENLHMNNLSESSYLESDLLVETLSNYKDKFVVFGLNVQSLHAKFDQLKILLCNLLELNLGIDVVCIQETWLSVNDSVDLYNIEGYTLISQTRCSSAHGGVCMYVRDMYGCSVLPLYKESTTWDGQFVQIQLQQDKNIIIGNIYRPPFNLNINYTDFFSELDPILDTLSRKRQDVLLCGDFNINLLKVEENPICQEFYDIITSRSFVPKITIPTRLSQNNGSLIDNIFCKISPNSLSAITYVLTSQISDHLPYLIMIDNIKTSRYNNQQKFITYTRNGQKE